MQIGNRNPLLVQLLTDLLDRPIVRPRVAEAIALGVARIAGVAIGLTQPTAPRDADTFKPAMPSDQRDAIRRHWRIAVARAVQPITDLPGAALRSGQPDQTPKARGEGPVSKAQ